MLSVANDACFELLAMEFKLEEFLGLGG